MNRLIPLFCVVMCAAQEPSREQVTTAMEKAAKYFRSISTEGGYLWRYSADLHVRYGETSATATQIWVQPPGTPAVGMSLLNAYRATKSALFLEAAQAAGRALLRGQLESGGWDYVIEFDPALRWKWSYRGSGNGNKNISTLDDDNSQSALRFLMELNREKPDPAVKSAVDYGLRTLLDHQYPNGAWPQRFPAPKEGYYGYYTFNDHTISDTVDTLILAWELYQDHRHLNAVRKAGDFIIEAQQKEPQPVWAQQYDLNMRPAWARKFEPPSVCSSESAGVLRILLRIHQAARDDKYLRPIPAAVEWFRRSSIGPGRWARFYELGTNRPLYFTRKYELTYDASDLPTHYSFQGPNGVESAIALWERYQKTRRLPEAERGRPDAARVRQILAAMDGQGRWVINGEIQSRVFLANLNALAAFIEGQRP